jgi:hypothetical protein
MRSSLFFFLILLILCHQSACQTSPTLTCETLDTSEVDKTLKLEKLGQLNGLWQVSSIEGCLDKTHNEQFQFTLNLSERDDMIFNRYEYKGNGTKKILEEEIWNQEINQAKPEDPPLFSQDTSDMETSTSQGTFLNINRFKINIHEIDSQSNYSPTDMSIQDTPNRVVKYTVILEDLKIQNSDITEGEYEKINEVIGMMSVYTSEYFPHLDDDQSNVQRQFKQPFRMTLINRSESP